MRQVLWIYGIAGLSWAVAFFLPQGTSPNDQAAQIEVASSWTPTEAYPISTIRYGNEIVEVEARLNRGDINPESEESLLMEVAIQGLGDAAPGKLTTLLVIDRSGSMAGDKIQAARMSAERLLYQLQDGDRFGIVSYGSDVNVDLPLTTLDPLSRTVARRTVQRIEEGGGTHLEGGLATAFRLLFGEDLRGRIGRILLISDGRPTEGARQLARFRKWANDFRSLGVTLSAVGVGRDYDAELLMALAEQSGGRFYNLREASELGRVLQDEIRHANRIVAQRVVLRLPEPLHTWAELAIEPDVAAGGYDSRDIWVGELAAGETRHLLLRIDIPPAMRASRTSLSFAAPELVYRRPTRQVDESLSHPNDAFVVAFASDFSFERNVSQKKVEAQAAKMRFSQNLINAMRQVEAGQVNEARRALEAEARTLEDQAQQTENPQLQREAASLRKVLDELEAAAGSGFRMPDLTKHQKAHALELRR